VRKSIGWSLPVFCQPPIGTIHARSVTPLSACYPRDATTLWIKPRFLFQPKSMSEPMQHDPQPLANATNPNDFLAQFGLHAAIEKTVLFVRWNGFENWYSSRLFVPVAFPGLGIHVEARLVRPGEGEIRIGAQILKFDGSENRLRMD
jgi:hypothetical protein